MAQTVIRGSQILNNTVQRQDLDTSTVGQAVVTKIVQGAGITLSSTGADSGTGDVTVTASVQAPFVSKTAAYTVLTADLGVYFICSGGSWTFTLPAAASGFWVRLRNDMGITGTTGTITVQPPAGTIDGAASKAILAQQDCTIICDGTNWRTFGLHREVILGTQDITTASANGIVLLPAGYRYFELTWADLTVATVGAILQGVVSVDGGTTWNATNYWYSLLYPNAATTAAAACTTAAATQWQLGGALYNTASITGLVQVKLYPGDASNAPSMQGQYGAWNNASNFASVYTFSGFINVLLGKVNAFKYALSSGNISTSNLTVKGIV